MSQITLRQIPAALDSQLRSLAKKNKTSLNKVILALLMKTMGLSVDSSKKRNLGDLCGNWNPDQFAEFKKNTEEFSRIDPEVWK